MSVLWSKGTRRQFLSLDSEIAINANFEAFQFRLHPSPIQIAHQMQMQKLITNINVVVSPPLQQQPLCQTFLVQPTVCPDVRIRSSLSSVFLLRVLASPHLGYPTCLFCPKSGPIKNELMLR